MRKSHEYFESNLERAIGEFKSAFHNAICLSYSESKEKRREAIDTLCTAMHRIVGFIHDSELPPWFLPLYSVAQSVRVDPSANNHQLFSVKLAENYRNAFNQVWIEPESNGIDIDGELRHIYSESNMKTLFDDLVSKLTALIDTGELENIHVIRSLESIIATVKRNINKPTTWRWILELCKKTMVNFAKIYPTKEDANPLLAASMEAVMLTIDGLENESNSMFQKAQEKITESIKSEVPLLNEQKVTKLLGHKKEDDNAANS